MQLSTFFQFLQIAIGTRSELPHPLSENDWQQLFDLCQRQALLGVGYHAIELLHQQGQSCPKPLALQWAILAQRIKEMNKQMTLECQKVSQLLKEEGFESCILKGQGNLAYYPAHLNNLRQSGDIDVWVHAPNTRHPVRSIIRYAERRSSSLPEVRYHHLDLDLSSLTSVEVHYRLHYLCTPWYNYRFQKWTQQQAESGLYRKEYQGFTIPSTNFNLVYQLVHIYRHFFEYGIGLRQLMDYYFVLKHHIKTSPSSPQTTEELRATLQHLGLWKFTQALMWTMAQVFEPRHEQQTWMFVPEDENLGTLLLHETIIGGNFGQYDHRTSQAHTTHFVVRAWRKTLRLLNFVRHYPSEVLCEPPFRIWHYLWRRFQWWRF